MPKFDENTNCYFVHGQECLYPLPEEDLKDALENWNEEQNGDILSQIPNENSAICTNYLLSQVIQILNREEEKR